MKITDLEKRIGTFRLQTILNHPCLVCVSVSTPWENAENVDLQLEKTMRACLATSRKDGYY